MILRNIRTNDTLLPFTTNDCDLMELSAFRVLHVTPGLSKMYYKKNTNTFKHPPSADVEEDERKSLMIPQWIDKISGKAWNG